MKPITRRDMLSATTLMGTAAAVGLPLISTTADGQQASATKSRLKVIVTGGHPGDPEYGCGGTISLYSDAGHDVVILYLNKGEGGPGAPRDAATVRVGE